MVGSGVLRPRSTVRNAGRFVVLRPPAISWIASEPPPTKHPPTTHRPTHHHSSTAALEQYVLTNPQRQHSSTAVRTTAVHLWYARTWVGFFSLSYDCPPSRGEREPSPERLFTPPTRGVGTRRPLCPRGHRGLLCGAGVARSCGRYFWCF